MMNIQEAVESSQQVDALEAHVVDVEIPRKSGDRSPPNTITIRDETGTVGVKKWGSDELLAQFSPGDYVRVRNVVASEYVPRGENIPVVQLSTRPGFEIVKLDPSDAPEMPDGFITAKEAGLPWVTRANIRGYVIELSTPDNSRAPWTMIVADDTGYVEVKLWREQKNVINDLGIKETTKVEVVDAVKSVYEGAYQYGLGFGSKGENVSVVELEPFDYGFDEVVKIPFGAEIAPITALLMGNASTRVKTIGCSELVMVDNTVSKLDFMGAENNVPVYTAVTRCASMGEGSGIVTKFLGEAAEKAAEFSPGDHMIVTYPRLDNIREREDGTKKANLVVGFGSLIYKVDD